MEVPWQNFLSDMEMEEGDFFNESNKNLLDDHELVLGKFLQQPAFSSDSESLYPPNNGGSCLSFEDTNTTNNFGKHLTKSNSSNSIGSQHVPHTATATTSPTSYVLCFDESSVVSLAGDTGELVNGRKCKGNNSCDQSKGVNISGSRKSRNSLESVNHIMAERKRRQELTERFIALSATIPGLKKIDKASILSEAITYVKQLKKRVEDLEEQRCCKKIRVESVSFINKTNFYNDEGSVSGDKKTNFDDTHELNVSLPEVEARVLEKEVLIRIHCKNQNGTIIKILTHLKSLHLSTISNSVLPFGNSFLDITIIAQMGEKYNLSVKEVVKSLRLALLYTTEY
ncbi:putative transcription factor bHLH family [Lupinus albus]|uniref:Putative transcription factor bHLH family n=1 Tax=Lupinus albus TaxID=3870 RepID=A0A6A4PGA6_LUPAL|nr:putative transcription factor bHLH family [Lupinus albus]